MRLDLQEALAHYHVRCLTGWDLRDWEVFEVGQGVRVLVQQRWMVQLARCVDETTLMRSLALF